MSAVAQSPHEVCQAVLTIDGSIGSDTYRDPVNPCKSTKSEKAAWENVPMTTTVERRYAYQRIAPGLVLLPGNDGKTFFAVGKYEDGPTWGLTDEPRDFTAWGWGRVTPELMERAQRYAKRGDYDDAVYALREVVFDNTWPRHQTMKAAIEDALRTNALPPREA